VRNQFACNKNCLIIDSGSTVECLFVTELASLMCHESSLANTKRPKQSREQFTPKSRLSDVIKIQISKNKSAAPCSGLRRFVSLWF